MRQFNPYQRSTEDLWVLQGYYGGYGWEDLTAETSRLEIRQRLKEYQENEGGTYRIVKKREKKPEIFYKKKYQNLQEAYKKATTRTEQDGIMIQINQLIKKMDAELGENLSREIRKINPKGLRGVSGPGPYFGGKHQKYGPYQWNVKLYNVPIENDWDYETLQLYFLGEHKKLPKGGYGFEFISEELGRPIESSLEGRSGGWLVVHDELSDDEISKIDWMVEGIHKNAKKFLEEEHEYQRNEARQEKIQEELREEETHLPPYKNKMNPRGRNPIIHTKYKDYLKREFGKKKNPSGLFYEFTKQLQNKYGNKVAGWDSAGEDLIAVLDKAQNTITTLTKQQAAPLWDKAFSAAHKNQEVHGREQLMSMANPHRRRR